MKKKVLTILILIGLAILSGRSEEKGKVFAQTGQWVNPTGHNDPTNNWSSPEVNAYDDNTATSTFDSENYWLSWSFFLELTVDSKTSDKIRYYVGRRKASDSDSIDVDVYKDGAWVDVFQGEPTWDAYQEKTFTSGVVTKARIRFHFYVYTGYAYAHIYDFDFWEIAPSSPPATVTKTMCAASSGNSGGVVSAQTITQPTTASAISERGFVATGYNDIDFPSYKELQDIYDYDSASPVPAGGVHTISTPGVYVSSSDYQLNASPCGAANAVIFVDGSLTVNTSFKTPAIQDSDNPLDFKNSCGSSLAFIVKDDINIEKNINNIYGIFYAGRTIDTTGGESSNKRLYIFGSLLANDFNFGRDLGADNKDNPAEQVIYMPQYLLDLGSSELLGQQKITWKEVVSSRAPAPTPTSPPAPTSTPTPTPIPIPTPTPTPICVVTPPTSSPDGKDNDCDGTVDEIVAGATYCKQQTYRQSCNYTCAPGSCVSRCVNNNCNQCGRQCGDTYKPGGGTCLCRQPSMYW